MVQQQEAAGADGTYYQMSRQIEQTALAEMNRCPKAGSWAAHVPGRRAGTRLIRPRSEYVGESDLSWNRLADP
jgi:hypothetical protein